MWQLPTTNIHFQRARRIARQLFARYDFKLIAQALVFIAAVGVYCFFVGSSLLILPPGFVILEVVAPIALLLWGAPDIKIDYSRILLFLVHVFIFSQISIPNFYAVPIAGLGWVNLRKIEVISLLSVTALAYATSKEVRTRAISIIQTSKTFNYCVIGFLGTLILSVPLSRSPQVSLGSLAQPLTTWYLIYFAVIAIKDMHLKFEGVFKSLIVNVVLVSIICVVERRLQRRVMLDVMPASLINSLMDNPSFSMILSNGTRSGAFRSVASFTTALSTGECAAMVLPFALYLSFHKPGLQSKAFGYAGILSVAIVLFTANARGAMLAAIATSLVYLLLVILLLSRRNRSSLLPALVGVTSLAALPAVALTDKFRYTVLGGGATAASNAGRSEQLRLAIPKFIQSPIWGHGLSMGAEVVGFNPGNYFTLDSYIIAVAIEMGLPGLICLLVMVFYPILAAAKLLVSTDGSSISVLGIMMALPMFSFAVNMAVLTQIENHGLLFLLIGLFATWRSYERSMVSIPDPQAVSRRDRDYEREAHPASLSTET